jgi:hypothetical protein
MPRDARHPLRLHQGNWGKKLLFQTGKPDIIGTCNMTQIQYVYININICAGQRLKKFGRNVKRYNLHATIPTVQFAHPKNHCWSGIGKMLNTLKEMNAVSAKGGGVYTSPNELCPALISLVLLHIFCRLLHSSARNHATPQFSMFVCSSGKKKARKKTLCCLLLSIFWGSCFLQLKRSRYLTVDLSCRKCRTTHRHTIRHWGAKGHFLNFVQTHCQKRPKKLKPETEQRISPAGLHCSARIHCRSELVRGCLAPPKQKYLGVTWESMDGANGQPGGKNRSTTFVLTAFISFGTFYHSPWYWVQDWILGGMRQVNARY